MDNDLKIAAINIIINGATCSVGKLELIGKVVYELAMDKFWIQFVMNGMQEAAKANNDEKVVKAIDAFFDSLNE